MKIPTHLLACCIAVLVTLAAGESRAQDYCDPAYSFNSPNAPPLGVYNVSNPSHLVVMEYGVYKGQNAFHIRLDMAVPQLATGGPVYEVVEAEQRNPDGTLAKPAVYGWTTWYESGSCQVLGQHAAWMMSLGVDAIVLDNSNLNHCVFLKEDEPDIFGCEAGGVRVQLRTVKDNLRKVYEYYHAHQVPIRIIPMIDGQLYATLYSPYPNGETPLQRALQFFHDLSILYPELPVMYKGRPLLTTYIGVPYAHDYGVPGGVAYNFLYYTPYAIDQLGLQTLFTYRIMAGVAESSAQCVFWDTYTSASNPTIAGLRRLEKPGLPRPAGYSYFQYPIWSFIDRFNNEVAPGSNPPCFSSTPTGGAPTYSVDPGDNKPENFTVTSAFPGEINHLWWDAPDAGLRNTTAVLDRFMQKANILQPRFLLLSQFNEFGWPDQGNMTAKTNDIEPTSSVNGGPGWGTTWLDAFRTRIADYKASLPRPINLSARGWVGANSNLRTGDFVLAGPGTKRVMIRGIGKGVEAWGITPGLPNAYIALLRLRDDLSGWDLVADNDTWASDARHGEIPTGDQPPHATDAALVRDLKPGTYSVYMYDPAGGEGNSMLVIDELNDPLHPELASSGHPFSMVASRGLVRSASEPLIAGIIVSGDQPQTLVITGTGPSWAGAISNALANPVLSLYVLNPATGANELVASNDNWQSSPDAARIQASGHAPSHPLEAAIIYPLQPNRAYTAIMSGVFGATGVGFIHTYAQ